MEQSVYLYILNVNDIIAYESEIVELVPAHYCKVYKTTKIREEALQALASGILLRKHIGIASTDELQYNQFGKPQLQNKSIHFNLSHDGEFAVLAVSNLEIGIDIEKIREVSWEAAERAFPDRLLRLLRNTASEKQALCFTKLWTIIEAVLKAEGSGFFIEPRKQEEVLRGWIKKSVLFEDYVVTCAARESFTIKMIQDDIKDVIRERDEKTDEENRKSG